ncbi:MAG: cytochrome c [Deltaproteobacteria bacterium]|nr:cytochrome c [Deltaproteobacteria bacterium]MBW2503193.1 cytochrome c [Deltaproteobacteria bacterium]MBW2520009.1 cytochrome c [Deltaproteobacteria bacterium]
MRLLKKTTLVLSLCLFCCSPFVMAASHEHDEHNTKSYANRAHHMESQISQGVQLSPSLLALLNQEMRLIQQGIMDMVPAIAAGEWDKVSALGQKIKESFILKQKLTDAQKEELHRVLPQQFIEMDMDFHKSAGMLAHAAEMKNADVVNFYFYKMNAACVSCHGKYAASRFPGLSKGGKVEHH